MPLGNAGMGGERGGKRVATIVYRYTIYSGVHPERSEVIISGVCVVAEGGGGERA